MKKRKLKETCNFFEKRTINALKAKKFENELKVLRLRKAIGNKVPIAEKRKSHQ